MSSLQRTMSIRSPGQLVNDILNPVSTDADAGTDTVDARVTAKDGDLASIAWLASQCPDFDDAFLDLGNLLLEKSLN